MAVVRRFQYPVVLLLEAAGDQLWGFKPALISELVAARGLRRTLMWFAQNTPKYDQILDRWGPVRTHLVATFISALNGCRYCTSGHAYALQLHYLKQHDRLFPLSELEILALLQSSEAEIVDTFEQALAAAELPAEIFLLQRLVELRQAPGTAVNQSDRNLCQLIDMFQLLNFYAIAGELESNQAHDSINKNRAIRDRYAAMRRSQRQALLYSQQQ